MNLFIFLVCFLAVAASSPICTFNNAVGILKNGSVEDEARLIQVIHKGRVRMFKSDSGLNSLLHFASMYRRLSVMKAIVRSGNVFIDQFNDKGFSALHLAVMIGNMESFRFLIAEGANPNLPCENDQKSPLQLAFKNKRTEIAKALMKHPKIDLSYTTPGKMRNFWHYAARYNRDHDLLSTLPQGDLALQYDYKGFAPIHRAALACNYTVISVLKDRTLLTSAALILSLCVTVKPLPEKRFL